MVLRSEYRLPFLLGYGLLGQDVFRISTNFVFKMWTEFVFRMWTDFVKFGSPTPPGSSLIWQPVTSQNRQ